MAVQLVDSLLQLPNINVFLAEVGLPSGIKRFVRFHLLVGTISPPLEGGGS